MKYKCLSPFSCLCSDEVSLLHVNSHLRQRTHSESNCSVGSRSTIAPVRLDHLSFPSEHKSRYWDHTLLICRLFPNVLATSTNEGGWRLCVLKVTCLWAWYLKKLWTDSEEIWWTGWVCDKDELIWFFEDPDARISQVILYHREMGLKTKHCMIFQNVVVKLWQNMMDELGNGWC